MTIDKLLEDLKIRVPQLEVRVLKLETTLEGIFKLLSTMSLELVQLKKLVGEMVSKHNVLNGIVVELGIKLEKGNKDEKNTEKDL